MGLTKLSDHNNQRRRQREAMESYLRAAAVACDNCGDEMRFAGTPNQDGSGKVKCPKCGASGYKEGDAGRGAVWPC